MLGATKPAEKMFQPSVYKKTTGNNHGISCDKLFLFERVGGHIDVLKWGGKALRTLHPKLDMKN